MFNGKYSNFTYGIDGSVNLNTEARWGTSILNNNRQHLEHFECIKNLDNIRRQNFQLTNNLANENNFNKLHINQLENKLYHLENFIDNVGDKYTQNLEKVEKFYNNATKTNQENLDIILDNTTGGCGCNRLNFTTP